MDQTRMAKIIFESMPKSRRIVEGPKLRWIEDEENQI
jgi:hypothetical protein